jgi:hypothetical protein
MAESNKKSKLIPHRYPMEILKMADEICFEKRISRSAYVFGLIERDYKSFKKKKKD